MEQYVKGFQRFYAGEDACHLLQVFNSINSGGEDVILAFIDDEEEVERPATTRSGRSINGRSEIDFLTLKNSEEVPYNGQNLFFQLTEVAGTSVE